MGGQFWLGFRRRLLVVCVVASFLTRGAMANLPFLQGAAVRARLRGLVDQRPWQTVAALAPLAVSAEEQGFAREAERLADHEVDQAFAMALRQAALETRALTGDALALQQKIDESAGTGEGGPGASRRFDGEDGGGNEERRVRRRIRCRTIWICEGAAAVGHG